MTREEAIKWMEETIQDAEGLLDKCSPALKEEVLEQNEVFKIAISALRSTQQLGKPLTLEQLREMDGQPVWVEFIGHPDGTPIEPLWMLVNCREKILVTDVEYVDWDFEGWFAYPYPPAHIDRSKWEFCLWCKDLQYLPHEMCADVKMPGGSEIGASFCPSCGRPLTEEAWAELERRLRG